MVDNNNCKNHASMNFTMLEEKFKSELYGQPFVYSILKSLKLLYDEDEKSKTPLVLLFNGDTGTGEKKFKK